MSFSKIFIQTFFPKLLLKYLWWSLYLLNSILLAYSSEYLFFQGQGSMAPHFNFRTKYFEAISKTSFSNSTLTKIFSHFRYENLSMVYSFQAILSKYLKIAKTRSFQMTWRREVDLK